MTLHNETTYKILISLAFGAAGFIVNLYAYVFSYGDYKIAMVYGLIFPLLIALSWGWKFGLLSALAGGCQSLWWLWGPTNGYVAFLFVPTFTLWMVWHGYFAERRERSDAKWWMNIYTVEVPFRILCSLNLLFPCRWLVSYNPPPWDWGAHSITEAPWDFSVFVTIKQICEAYVYLLAADMLLHLNPIRRFFRLKPVDQYERTGYVIGLFMLVGCLFWVLDSLLNALIFHSERPFSAFFALDIPNSNLFTRIFFFAAFLVGGIITARILRKQKLGELELKASKEEDEQKEAFLKALVKAIPDLVFVKDPNGVYLSCNAGVEKLIGRSEAEIVGKSDYDFFDRETADAFRRDDTIAIDQGAPHTYMEKTFVAADGRHDHIETSKVPMYDTHGGLVGVLGISRDVTQRIALQAQLAQAQKMESIGRLAGGVAHDLNNMLMVILGKAELSLLQSSSEGRVADNIRAIKDAAQRSSRLTNQLLAFARKQAISPKVLDLNSLIEETLKMLKQLIGENIEVSWRPKAEVWPVKMDPTQVDQVLTNLLVNARDSIADIGKIEIETRNVVRPPCGASTDESADYVMVRIADSGCGMDAETRERIFEPFYTTKKFGAGTGLGLATAYGIVQQNGGFIEVSSELQKGSIFDIFIPRYEGGQPEAATPAAAKVHPTGQETILLVEDELSVLTATKEMLEQLGYRVLPFLNPKQAIEALGACGRIDLVLTDLVLPEMNGRELSRVVTATYPEVQCLFMSGYMSEVINPHRVLEEGLNFIEKPFMIGALAIKLRQILDEAP